MNRSKPTGGTLELDFGPRERVERQQSKLLRVLGDVVDELGIVVATGACDCGRTELLDALSHRASRYFRTDWFVALYEVANPDQRRRLRDAIAPEELPKTPEQKLAELREYMAANAAGALRSFDKEKAR